MTKSKETDYTSIIAELEAKRAAIDAAITGLKILAGFPIAANDSSGQSTPISENADNKPDEWETEIRSDTFFGKSIPSAAREYLQMVKRPKGTKDICVAIQKGGILTQSKNFYITVHSALTRDSNFVRVKKEWGLTEWYPGRIKQKQQKDDSKDE